MGSPGINSSGGRVQAISGANGLVLFTYDGDPADGVGWAMAIADVKGDLKPEIVVSGYYATASSGGTGYVKVFGRVP